MENSTGTSDFMVWLPTEQPSPDFEIIAPSHYEMINTEGAIPNSPSSFSYINSIGQALGGITNLNNSEMLILLDKHCGG